METTSSPPRTARIRFDRLRKLADFLDTLKRDAFNFGTLVDDWDWNGRGRRQPGCGTVACAWGWAPHVFPRLLEWRAGTPMIRARAVCGPWYWNASDFFGLNTREVLHLFSPGQVPWNKGPVYRNATPKQVAASIRRYVAWKKAGGEL